MIDIQYPPTYGDQREMLIAFNNLQRQSLLWKLEGLSEDQVRIRHQPSGMSLLGLLKHLTRVEQTWFAERLMGEKADGNPTAADAWSPTPDETLEVLCEQYRQACSRSNDIARSIPLEQTVIGSGDTTLQWILFHMLEETARHLGHADFLREAIDGATGVNPQHEARRQAQAYRKREASDDKRGYSPPCPN